MTGCPFFVIDRGKLLQHKLIHVLVCLRKKSTEADPKVCFDHGVLKGY
jgi:hypothetical protein